MIRTSLIIRGSLRGGKKIIMERVHRHQKLMKKSLILAGVLAFFAVAAVFAFPVNATSVTNDCPPFSSGVPFALSNSGGFVVTPSGTSGTVTYGVTVPAESNLIEVCVYPNGGNIGTVSNSGNCPNLSSQNPASSTLISACSPGSSVTGTWKAGLDCSSTCVAAERLTGGDTLFAGTYSDVLQVTYTSTISPYDQSCTSSTGSCIVLHVSDEGSGVCGTGGTQSNPLTCYIIPQVGPTPPIPVFPLGTILAILAPLAAFGAFVVVRTRSPKLRIRA